MSAFGNHFDGWFMRKDKDKRMFVLFDVHTMMGQIRLSTGIMMIKLKMNWKRKCNTNGIYFVVGMAMKIEALM